jgi:transcriptional regulator with XRE-family HTH domain
MARKAKSTPPKTGLFHAREARGMSRSELVRLSGVSKQQLSRLENGLIRLRLDHLEPYAAHVGYTPEQILLWGRFPGTGEAEVEARKAFRAATETYDFVPELAAHVEGADAASRKKARKAGSLADPLKPERWGFPPSFVRDQLQVSADHLVVIEIDGDSMAPTVTSGDRVIVDTGHKTPAPAGLYAIRDPVEGIVVRRLQLLRSAQPPRVKVISDNPKHATEEIQVDEVMIFGKVVCCLKLV